jgi:cobyrinic acid a,c-diamide synthase
MNNLHSFPRLVIAGISGSSGKTIVSVGLLQLLRHAGIEARAFKKGPDYIDTAWLGWASSHTARNLDTYLMGPERALESFTRHAAPDGINLIEGNRGIFDGFDAAGTHSTAALARCLCAPVILVVNASKMTRTAAALVLGCQKLDPAVAIRGVVLNHVSGERHREVLRSAIESACSIPVVGTLPKVKVGLLPERHLGLVPPEEHSATKRLEQDLLGLVKGRMDLEALLAIARSAPPLPRAPQADAPEPIAAPVSIAYMKDAAFTFYYPENLEQLERAGARLIPVSALHATALPENLQALYIGGGFPETHAQSLSENSSFLQSLRRAALRGLPIYAECGGLMLLARNLLWKGARYPMAGVFPFDVEVCGSSQGHGYSELRVDKPNPFLPAGLTLRGHEFHYSRVLPCGETVPTACVVDRGVGCFDKREFVMTGNVVATYTHLHALASPEWATGIVNAARGFTFQAASRTGNREIGVASAEGR